MTDYAERRAERAENLAELPPIAYATQPRSKSVVLIKRGEKGWTEQFEITRAGITAAALNARIGVSEAAATAMLVGAVFGWHVPGANPAQWEKQPCVA